MEQPKLKDNMHMYVYYKDYNIKKLITFTFLQYIALSHNGAA